MAAIRNIIILLGAFAVLSLPAMGLAEETKGETEEDWNEIREFLFQDKAIRDGSEFISLDVPTRLPHGAKVRVGIRSSYPQDGEQYIAKHYLIVDKNPSPLAALFDLAPDSGSADVETDIRVNEYSDIRVVSENQRGDLYMTSVFVKVSGGCSLPPMNYSSMGEFEIGKMEFVEEKKPDVAQSQPGQFRVSVLHPSYSGMQKDQIKLYFIPPHYVENVEVRNGQGKKVLAVSGDISFSEDPNFIFSYLPESNDDVLTVKVTDSEGQVYQSTWATPLSTYDVTAGR